MPCFSRRAKYCCKRSPVGRDVIVIVARAVGLDDGVIERRDGTAFARDLGRDALVDLRGQARIDQDRQFRLAQHVDEAGRDDHAVASMVRVRGASLRLPMAAILPSRMPMSPEYQGEPVPSMMWPLVMTRSKAGFGAWARER